MYTAVTTAAVRRVELREESRGGGGGGGCTTRASIVSDQFHN